VQEDSTPLHYAAENGHLETVKVLLDKGADQTLRDRWRRSPMDLADSNRRYDVRLLLKEHVGTPLGIFNKAPPGSLTPGSSSMTPKVRLSALASVLPSFRSPHDMAATCVCASLWAMWSVRGCASGSGRKSRTETLKGTDCATADTGAQAADQAAN